MKNELILKNIEYGYGNKSVLNGISFSCSNGITAILGNNGAGKTTLMKILTLLKNPSNGDIFLNDKSILDDTSIKKCIGYLPQNFDFYGNVTGYDFLSYVCDIKGVNKKDKKEHIKEIVETFNLSDVIHKNIWKYSGGYKRRLGIAQAVIGNPKIVIVDEPTVGLDPEQRLEFRQYLSKIGVDKIVIISTHIIEDIELCSDKVVVIKDGIASFEGTVNEAINKASNNIYSLEVPKDELAKIREKVKVIEENRINSDLVKIKYINTKNIQLENSKVESEVSLENAYVYFQEKL